MYIKFDQNTVKYFSPQRVKGILEIYKYLIYCPRYTPTFSPVSDEYRIYDHLLIYYVDDHIDDPQ